jgi:peptidoglycan/LPS O-acetylase OafA/YrhL
VPAYDFVELGFFFFAGVCFRVHRSRIPADWRVAAGIAAIAIATLHSRFAFAGCLVAVPYLTDWIAMAPIPLHAITTRIGDISYGFYLYAFPVQQAVYQLFSGALGFWRLMAAAFRATAALTWLSSRWIERPALAWKARLLG